MKIINPIFITILFIIVSIYQTEAQDFEESDAFAMIENTDYERQTNIYNTSSRENSQSNIDLEMKAKVYDLSISKEFGSYLNPYNGMLNISNRQNNHYTKAQFSNTETNEIVFSIKIEKDVESIDISKIKIGSYILILSNEEGAIRVEDFIII